MEIRSKKEAKSLVSGLRREIRALGATAGNLGHNAACDLLARAMGFSGWPAYLVTQSWRDGDQRPAAVRAPACEAAEAKPTMCRCDNCESIWSIDALNPCVHLQERMDLPVDHPEAIIPDGDCPSCGAFCYETESAEEDSDAVEAIVGIYEHRHGISVSVHAFPKDAADEMNSIADQWWETEFPGEPRPVDQSQLGELYFARIAEVGREESFTTETTMVPMEVFRKSKRSA